MEIKYKEVSLEIKDVRRFNTEIMEIFQETSELYEKFPGILSAIESDLDKHGLRKKQLRNETKSYYDKLINGADYLMSLPERTDNFCIKLHEGRPRMKPELVLHLLVLRGLWGSLSDYDAIERLYDSKAVEEILLYYGHKYPGITTVRENLNAVSNETRELILQCQIRQILESELDDFYDIYIDSTVVKGNTAYPTDISVLYKLLDRVHRGFMLLEKFGLPKLSSGWIPARLRKMNKHLSFMSMQAGKQGMKGKVKGSYKLFSLLALRLIDNFFKEQDRLTPYWEGAELPPAKELALESLWYAIDSDLQDAAYVLYYADLSLNEDIKLPSVDKVLSISDKNVAYIKKGQRNMVVGYKPQIARSWKGFICGYITPVGNAADSAMLMPVVEKVMLTTGIKPSVVSVDDGYSSQQNLDELRNRIKIPVTSFSGAKGKKLTVEDWDTTLYTEARRMRSAIESLMFTIKFNHRFGILRRRNIDAVNAEQLEKIIAYNFVRIVRKKRERLTEKIAS